MDDENVVELRWIFSVIKRHLWIIVACVVVGTASAFTMTSQIPPMYKASTALLIHVSNMSDYSAIITSERLALTYSQMITGRPVLETVISKLNLDETPAQLAERVTVAPVKDTQLVEVSAQDTNPTRAAWLANSIAEVFIGQIEDLSRRRLAFRTDVVVVEPAQIPKYPVRNQALYTALAGLVSAFIGIGLAFLLDYLDDTIKSPEDVAKNLELDTLGTIGRLAKGDKELIADAHSPPFVAEAFYVLRANLRYSNVNKPLRIILVTSPNPLEGKSVTVANLAVTMAQSGLNVVVVDADLRRPRLHQLFGVDVPKSGNGSEQPWWGLTGALLDGNTHNRLYPTQIKRLWLMPSGELPPNPAEMVGSQPLQKLLTELAQKVDIVLIDSPPVLPVADAAALAQATDGVLMVLKSGSTRQESARQAVKSLRQVDAHLVGAVLTGVPVSRRQYYYSTTARKFSANGRSGHTRQTQPKWLAGVRRFMQKRQPVSHPIQKG
jgi:capsular exopolysaccharide synthesis family protein